MIFVEEMFMSNRVYKSYINLLVRVNGISFLRYPPVNKHSNGKSPSWIGNTSSNGGFSIAMLDYRSVPHYIRCTSRLWVNPHFTTTRSAVGVFFCLWNMTWKTCKFLRYAQIEKRLMFPWCLVIVDDCFFVATLYEFIWLGDDILWVRQEEPQWWLRLLQELMTLMLIKLSCCDNVCVYDDKLGGGTTPSHNYSLEH